MVDAVCPLVTKVHHEVKVRAGKGYQIVYVGHDGHEEAVGTMAVAPDAIHRVESRRRGRRPPRLRPAGRPARPDDAVAPRLAGRARPHPRALPRAVDPGPQRPVLRHHQPPGRAHRAGRALRRHRRHRLGQLVEHPGARVAGPRHGLRAGLPGQRRRRAPRRPRRASSASPPAPAPPRSSSEPVIARLDPATASRRSGSPTRRSTSRRPATSASCSARSTSSPPSPLGGTLTDRPSVVDRDVLASDALDALA